MDSTPRATSHASFSSSPVSWLPKYWYSTPMNRATDSRNTDSPTAIELRKIFDVKLLHLSILTALFYSDIL